MMNAMKLDHTDVTHLLEQNTPAAQLAVVLTGRGSPR